MKKTEEGALALEQHYNPEELARLWRRSPTTIRKWFREEPGVLKHGNPVSVPGKKRAHQSLNIPGSIATRVHNQKSGA